MSFSVFWLNNLSTTKFLPRHCPPSSQLTCLPPKAKVSPSIRLSLGSSPCTSPPVEPHFASIRMLLSPDPPRPKAWMMKFQPVTYITGPPLTARIMMLPAAAYSPLSTQQPPPPTHTHILPLGRPACTTAHNTMYALCESLLRILCSKCIHSLICFICTNTQTLHSKNNLIQAVEYNINPWNAE